MTLCPLSRAQKINHQQHLNLKISEFSIAMEKYNNNRLYARLQLLVSIFIVSFQALSLIQLGQSYNGTGFIVILCTLLLAYVVTDFINGLVHMYMDNNDNYSSIVGPFIANFHTHHATPKYAQRHPIKIYFYESGTKFWLLAYLFILVCIQKKIAPCYSLNMGLVAFGILSSLAEVSHYWCHNSTHPIIQKLQQYRLLLPMKHHKAHHRMDNTHYAFLNGVSDPLLNIMSRYYYRGYKNNADKHVKAYLKRLYPNKNSS